MAANFWKSSHHDQWIFDKVEVARMQAGNLRYYTEEEYAKFHIFWANLMTTIATDSTHQSSRASTSTSTSTGHRVRQQVIATAVMYFKRFYLVRTFQDMSPFLVAATSIYLACKVEEHQTLSVSSLFRSLADNLPKRYGTPFDSELSKNTDIYEAEFILVETLDCSLIVYHPSRPLKSLLAEMQKSLQLKDFDQIEPQCHKVCNDTIRCDVGLQFSPHCIAIACIIVGVGLMGRGDEITPFLTELNTDIEKLQECTDQVYNMYHLWKEFDEKEQVRGLIQKLPVISSLPPPIVVDDNMPLGGANQPPVNFVIQEYMPMPDHMNFDNL